MPDSDPCGDKRAERDRAKRAADRAFREWSRHTQEWLDAEAEATREEASIGLCAEPSGIDVDCVIDHHLDAAYARRRGQRAREAADDAWDAWEDAEEEFDDAETAYCNCLSN